MFPYSLAVEDAMRNFCDSLREKDRRRYAAVEATELGHGGVAYIARLLHLAPRTVRQGLQELQRPPDLPPERCRKKGEAEKERSIHFPTYIGPSGTCCTSTPPAAPSTPTCSGPT